MDGKRAVTYPGFTATTKNVLVDGEIRLHIRLGYLRVNVWFGIVPSMAFTLLFGTYCLFDASS